MSLDDTQLVKVHLSCGKTLLTTLEPSDLEGAPFFDSYEELVEHALSDPPKPHWCWIGELHLFTQAISAVEMQNPGQ